jgi:glucosamine-6-phosphate deaminase
VEALSVRVYAGAAGLAVAAAQEVCQHLRSVLDRTGSAAIILATGNSQLQFLDELIRLGGVDWSKITLFHMDEYLGIDANHPASFRRYLRERAENRLRPRAFHYLAGDALEPIKECDRYADLLAAQPIELCMLGIGENGHLAFNDPPVADFDDPRAVKVVALDEVCRRQQVKQGHFPAVETVPRYALTLTIPTLCSTKKMVCLATEDRKAEVVQRALHGPITEDCPASVLRRHRHALLLLDDAAAGRL